MDILTATRDAARAALDAAVTYDEVRAASFVLGQIIATQRLLEDGGYTPYNPGINNPAPLLELV